MKHDNRYVWLDLVRGLSALAVCASHLRAAMFVDYSQLSSPGIITKIFYFITGLGHQSVVVFFVLSGFFVGGSILSRRNNFAFMDYLLARVSRLWTVLFPALIFTLIIDRFLASYLPELLSGERFSILNSGPNYGEYSSSLLTFIGNAVFLQTIYTPIFGTNGPLWSLANEFWYYVLFPLAMISIGYTHTSSLNKFTSSILFVIIAIIISPNMLLGFIIWLLGAGVYHIYATIKDSFLFDSIFFIAICFALLCFAVTTQVSTSCIYHGW